MGAANSGNATQQAKATNILIRGFISILILNNNGRRHAQAGMCLQAVP